MHGGGPRGAAFKAEGGGLCGGGVPRVGWGRVCCLPSCLRRRLRGAAAVVPGQHGRVPRCGGHRLHQLLDQRLGSLRPRPPIPPRPGVSARPPGPPPCRAHPDGAHPPRRDFHAVDPQDPVGIHQLMLDTAEQELGIQPVLSSTEMASMAEPDRLGLITYLSQFYEAFKPSPGEGFRGGLSHPERPPGASWVLPAVRVRPQHVPSAQRRRRSAGSRCPPAARGAPSSSSASCRRAAP